MTLKPKPAIKPEKRDVAPVKPDTARTAPEITPCEDLPRRDSARVD